MSDINDESRHIESIDRFLTVCIERLQTETKTSDRFFTQTAFKSFHCDRIELIVHVSDHSKSDGFYLIFLEKLVQL